MVSPLSALLMVALPLAMALTDTEKGKFSSAVTITTSGSNFVFSSNNMPDHAVGDFPNADNPNTIQEQAFTMTVPSSPSKASTETCTPLGPVGMAINGVAIFNVYTREKTDAVVYEVFDSCDGHPDPMGYYHYHQIPDCIYKGGNDEFIGVALDGFPIYGPKDANGNELTSADLDICHGKDYNGAYRYHLTRDFPYTVGCFKGEVTLTSRQLANCEIATADNAGSTAPRQVAGSVLATVISSVICMLYVW